MRELDEAGLSAPHGKGKAPLDGREILHFWNDLSQKLLLNYAETILIRATNVPVPEGVRAFSPGRVEAINKSAMDMAHKRKAISTDLHKDVRIRRSEMKRPGDFMLNEVGISLVLLTRGQRGALHPVGSLRNGIGETGRRTQENRPPTRPGLDDAAQQAGGS